MCPCTYIQLPLAVYFIVAQTRLLLLLLVTCIYDVVDIYTDVDVHVCVCQHNRIIDCILLILMVVSS